MIDQQTEIPEKKEITDNPQTTFDVMPDVQSFPGFTTWENSRYCCFKANYIRSINRYFWGEWEIDICMPLFVITTIILSYAIYMWSMITNIKDEKLLYFFLIPVMTILFLLFLISYVNIIRTGPGYYPFYYSNRESLPNPPDIYLINQECTMSGIISNREQHEYCHSGEMPPRSILSKSARRIVMKPDHLCGWTATWIGKKNFKLFILFNVYGMIYCFIYCATGWIPLKSLFSSHPKLDISAILVGFMLLFAFNFFCFTMSFSCSSLKGLCRNQTSWESWNHIDKTTYDEGLLNNCKDSCGDNVCTWLCPTAPFKGKRNDDLMRNYKKYPRNHASTLD